MRFFILISKTYKKPVGNFINNITLVTMTILLLIVPVLIVRQFIYLYSHFDKFDVVLGASLLICIPLLLQSAFAIQGGVNLVEGGQEQKSGQEPAPES